MDSKYLVKEDELNKLGNKSNCSKAIDKQKNCQCSECFQFNGLTNLGQQLNDSETNLQTSFTKKFNTLNPIASLKNVKNSLNLSLSSLSKTKSQNMNMIKNENNLNNSIDNSASKNSNCLNMKINKNLNSNTNNKIEITHDQNINYIHPHDNQHHQHENDTFLNDWYVHCHANENKNNDATSESANRRLLITTFLCGFFLILELFGGYFANSLSIMTDAAHLLSDLVSFGLSLFAVYLSKKKPTKRFTFGYQRAEILGAICSILLIWVLTAVVVYFAIQRVITMDFEIESTVMMIVAMFGIAVNVLMGITLHGCMCTGLVCNFKHEEEENHFEHNYELNNNNSNANNKKAANHNLSERQIELQVISNDTSENGINLNKVDAFNRKNNTVKKSHFTHSHHGHTHDHNHENINIRAAFIHVLGDLIQSIGVFISAIIIHFKPEWKIADPICTFLFSVIVLFTTVRIIKESILIIMECAPDNIDYMTVKLNLLNINGVQMVHNLFIWQLTVNNVVASVHLVVANTCNIEQVLQRARILLKDNHNITHVTIQCERYLPQIMLACDNCNEL